MHAHTGTGPRTHAGGGGMGAPLSKVHPHDIEIEEPVRGAEQKLRCLRLLEMDSDR